MSRAVRRLTLILMLLAIVGPSLPNQAAARQSAPAGYTVSSLLPLQPAGTDRVTATWAVAINSKGDVAGRVEAALDRDYPGFPINWRSGEPKWLGPDGEIGDANDINTGRRAVGFTRSVPSAAATAVVWMKGEAAELTSLGGDESVALAINDKNAIVGWSANALKGDPNRAVHACLWTGTKVTDLGSLNGANGDSIATDINAKGQVVGASTMNLGNFTPTFDPVDLATGVFDGHAVLWDGETPTDLGTLGGDESVASAINDTGQVVGSSRLKTEGTHAFIWENGTMTDLGVLPEGGSSSYAADINQAGQVVGLIEGYGGYGRVAFLWQNGEMIDLNTLIPADSGWVLFGGLGINDAGQIVGFGQGPQGETAFLLTPVA